MTLALARFVAAALIIAGLSMLAVVALSGVARAALHPAESWTIVPSVLPAQDPCFVCWLDYNREPAFRPAIWR